MIIRDPSGTTQNEMAFLPSIRDLGARPAAACMGALLGLAACDLTDTGRSGELERGTFYYQCDNNPDDGFCDRGAAEREFPTAVAAGGYFRIDYTPDDSTVYFDIVSGCLDCMERTSDGFIMETEGRAPLLVENSQGQIYDVLHIEAKIATELVVRVDDEPWPDGELLLTVASLHDLGVTPEAADGTELGGALEYSWEIGDDSVVELVSSGARNDIEILAKLPGETTITVHSGELSFEIPVRVKEVG